LTLRKQHGEILEIVRAITAAVAGGSCPEVRTHVDRLRAALLAHLALEDSQLYPELTKAGEESGQALSARIAKTYERNMETISVALKAFLEQYAADFELADFSRDWQLVSQMLSDRIASEEATLYPLYESWIGSRPE
jgi:hypothetical protein